MRLLPGAKNPFIDTLHCLLIQGEKKKNFYKYILKLFAFSFIDKCNHISQTEEFVIR